MRQKICSIVFAVNLLFTATNCLAQWRADHTPDGLFKFAFSIFENFQLMYRIDGAIDENKIISMLGEPIEKKEWSESDSQEPGLSNRYKSSIYEGLEIITVSPLVGNGKKIWLNRIRLKSSNYVLVGGLRIGQPINDFMDKLGIKNGMYDKDTDKIKLTASGNENIDGVSFAGHATVTIGISKSGKVTSVEWEYWAD